MIEFLSKEHNKYREKKQQIVTLHFYIIKIYRLWSDNALLLGSCSTERNLTLNFIRELFNPFLVKKRGFSIIQSQNPKTSLETILTKNIQQKKMRMQVSIFEFVSDRIWD